MKIKNDIQAIKALEKIINNQLQNEEEWDLYEDALESYQKGISDVLREIKLPCDAQKVLALARERNKPIIL